MDAAISYFLVKYSSIKKMILYDNPGNLKSELYKHRNDTSDENTFISYQTLSNGEIVKKIGKFNIDDGDNTVLVDRQRQRRLQTCDYFDPSSASDPQSHACSLQDVLFGIQSLI